MDYNLVDKTLVSLVDRLAILKQFINTFSSAPYPDLISMVKEANEFRVQLLEKAYLFLVKNPVTGEALGFDNFKFTD